MKRAGFAHGLPKFCVTPQAQRGQEGWPITGPVDGFLLGHLPKALAWGQAIPGQALPLHGPQFLVRWGRLIDI